MEISITELKKEETEEIDQFVNEEWKVFNESRGYEYKSDTRKLIARTNKDLCGFIVFKIVGGVGYLSELIVSRKSRGLGIGKSLVEKFEEICKKNDCHKVYLETSEKYSEAVKFYEKMGYTKEVVLDNFKFHFTWYLYFKEL